MVLQCLLSICALHLLPGRLVIDSKDLVWIDRRGLLVDEDLLFLRLARLAPLHCPSRHFRGLCGSLRSLLFCEAGDIKDKHLKKSKKY